jgi:hypothetical protein
LIFLQPPENMAFLIELSDQASKYVLDLTSRFFAATFTERRKVVFFG